MDKTIEYFMNLPYTRELTPVPEGGWFVRIKELPNCMSQGDTPEEALRMIGDAMRGWIEVELEDGEQIPEPRVEEEYSGKFNTRVPKSLHRKMVEAADREGVSLNQWINTALAEAVGDSAARIPARAAIADQSTAARTWPGLAVVIQHILADVGMSCEAGEVDERLFAGWLDQNQEDIRIECQQDDHEQALNKARALSVLLQEHKDRSPVLESIYKIVMFQSSLLEQSCELKQSLLAAEQMRAQISAVLGSVNSPALARMRVTENERHAAYSAPPRVEPAVLEAEPGRW
jgi:antitoxin HicB